MNDDRRAVLEGIAYGADPKVTPGDRLRALEMLGATTGENRAVYDLSGLSGEQLDRELEGFLHQGQRDPGAERRLAELAGQPLPDEPLPTFYERVLRRRAERLERTVRARVEQAARQLAAGMAQRGAQDEQRSGGVPGKGLVPVGAGMTSGQLQALAERRRMEEINAELDAERRGLPRSTSRPCPPGIDPTDWALWGAAQDGTPFNFDPWD